MDHHLNAFRFYNESTEKEFIENNLSRAFALCLISNAFFLNEYIKGVVSEEDHEYLFSALSSDTKCTIDIQIDTASIDKENYRTVYAVAMTTDRGLSMGDFFKQRPVAGKKNITDLIIAIKDIAIIIEVKRSGEDCKAQLYNQVLPFLDPDTKNKITVVPKRYSWQDVVKLLERVKNVQQLSAESSIFIRDFLELAEIRYSEWFEPKPFATIPFISTGTPNLNALNKRMRQALVGLGNAYPLLPYDRLGVSVAFGWASELLTTFSHNKETNDETVDFSIYPGNTKQQGYPLFDRPMDWTAKKSLLIDGKEYPLTIERRITLCHFYKYVGGIYFSNEDCRKPLHTKQNFYAFSGKWGSDKWKELEDALDAHFKPQFDWREHCGWKKNFTDTDRSYLTMAFGYEVWVSIPFSKFKAMDKKNEDITKVSDFVSRIALAYEGLLE